MIYEDKQLPELLYMKHRHDNDKDYIKYDEELVEKTFSSYLFKNENMNIFLRLIQPLLSRFFDMFNIIKNWQNYTVDKDYYKHKN